MNSDSTKHGIFEQHRQSAWASAARKRAALPSQPKTGTVVHLSAPRGSTGFIAGDFYQDRWLTFNELLRGGLIAFALGLVAFWWWMGVA